MSIEAKIPGRGNGPIEDVRRWLRSLREKKQVRRWERAGQPVPAPNLVKQSIVRESARKHGTRILVETGTYLGDMVDAMRNDFDRIYSIELSRELFERARDRFQRYSHIEIIHGDSGQQLEMLMPKLDQPTLFWLDGHYSGGPTAQGSKDTPILEELDHIYGSPDVNSRNLKHVVLIDDIRCFGSEPTYPSLEALETHIRNQACGVGIEVQTDVLKVIPS